MELIDSFQEGAWVKANANEQEGFADFRIASSKPTDTPGQFNYVVFDEEGDVKNVLLCGAGKKDPLHGMGVIEAKLSEDGKLIVGVNIFDDCVLYNSKS